MKRSPYSPLTKAIVTAPSRAYVADRPYHVYSIGPWGDAMESRYSTLIAAMEHADKIVGKSAPGAIVRKGKDILYRAGKP